MNRKIVGAHYGLKDWIAQRATAVFMAIYTVVFAICALTLPELSYSAWSGLFSNGLMKFASFLFFLSVFYHAWIGVRDIWMDYVKPDGLRLSLHLITLFLLVGYAGWAAQILWRL
ncbi:probable succinate dehydrogenase, hydrophobic membrane anchor subunit [Azoarcus olearius]|uniref:Succinate dehydrogenase hydrophobic membrane anchor subunit n=1 Tax=Azoarcus sp. (strain BH72) TaxID=418699 RepID=A1K5R2_AZOSB|nr:succinate dehydrogenase, hydrophobic membrane anchor subunit [Azoarcus olearius]CAL94167.1 probable succinate dehydrogenase, hydrophobic membrane anchor subunit [Azoarcus olearius]